MATVAQISANRRNAALSTGPRTDEGKAHSRVNALQHGLLADKVMVVEDGELAEFMSFREEIWADLDPVGRMETTLADRVVSLSWRLIRAGHIERGLLMINAGDDRFPPAARLALAFRRDAEGADAISRVVVYEQRLERSLYRTLRELERRQGRRLGQAAPAAVDIHLTVD